MEDAGIWIRVSTGRQDEANQLPDLERHCAGRYNIARRYEVHGKSASKGRHQSDLDQMLTDMRNGVIKVLVIWHSDRIERRPGKALLDLLAEVSLAGGRVESVKEPTLGQLDFGSQVTTFIAGLVNHEKSAHLADQTVTGHDHIRKNGAFTGRIPFGYETEGVKWNKRLVPTEQGRALIEPAYDMIIDGRSLRDVAVWLAGKTGKTWSPKIVAELIRRPTYRGNHEHAHEGITYVHKCEALVPADKWKRANDSLNARPKGGKVYAANRAMLAGVLTCPTCGATMLRTRDGRGGPYYYRCAGLGVIRKSTCRNMVRVSLVDEAVNRIIAKTFNVAILLRRLVPGHDHSAELAELAYEMQGLASRGLSWDEEDAKRAGLRAEYARVKALPSVPDSYELVPNGHTYAGVWEGLDCHERGAWLASKGFTVTASKIAVTVSHADTGNSVTVPLSSSG